MEKKKLYIIFTTRLDVVGGAEMYTAGKANYLKKLGWRVECFSTGSDVGNKSAISYLDEYLQKGNGAFKFLSYHTNYFRALEREIFLNILINHIGIKNFQEYEIIIESHHLTEHLWGELLAAKIGARHFLILLHESAAYGNNYRAFADFFYFKWQRNEMVAGAPALKRIFKCYKNISATLYEMPDTVHELEPIQDIPFSIINQFPKSDWNICHFGRANKLYVPYVIEGVAAFARRHRDKKINFIFIGNIDSIENFIIENFKGAGNVALIALGDLVPVPKILFSIMDVVCATAQSALFSANEGAITIAGNAETVNKTQGVLGYDTMDQTYGEVKFSYVEALENVLVKRLYKNKKSKFPKLKPAEEYYKDFWTIVEKAAPSREYYIGNLSQDMRNWTAIFPFGSISRGTRVIFFGATEIAEDYKKQIESQQDADLEFGEGYIKNFIPKPYCTILAIVDEHPEKFDNSVVGIERLKQKDYDAIIITTFQNQAQAAANKIIQIVPDMANRIIYKFRTLQI